MRTKTPAIFHDGTAFGEVDESDRAAAILPTPPATEWALTPDERELLEARQALVDRAVEQHIRPIQERNLGLLRRIEHRLSLEPDGFARGLYELDTQRGVVTRRETPEA